VCLTANQPDTTDKRDIVSAPTQTVSVRQRHVPSTAKDDATSSLCTPCENQTARIYKHNVNVD